MPVLGEAKALRAEKLLATVEKTELYTEDLVRLSKELEGKNVEEAIEKQTREIDEFFTSKEFLNRLEDRFSKYNGKLSRTEWENRYKTLYKNREIGTLTEEQFQLLEGGLKPKKGITTSDGKRYFDNVLGNVSDLWVL